MTSLPANVMEFIAKEGTVKALVTATEKGEPHAIVAGSINAIAPDTIIYAEIMSKKSAANLGKNKKAAFLFVNGLVSYTVNCTVKERVDKGPMLDGVNAKLAAMKLKAAAVWVFTVDSVFDQSASGTAGKKLA